MKSVLLRLAGPLQSWGTQGRFGIRDTDREPSKSGLLGLVGAALGMSRDDAELLGRLRSLAIAVRVDREGTPVRDYHTVGGGAFRGKQHGLWSIEERRLVPGLTALTERYYLADASFLVGLGGADDQLLDAIARALRDPLWPLYLGRRGCPPAESVYVGMSDDPPAVAVRAAPMIPRDRAAAPERLRMVVEADPDSGSPRQDDPESFALYDRRHAVRYVRVDFISRDSLPEVAA
jgi:CRISPR system Cascade subunit CasD